LSHIRAHGYEARGCSNAVITMPQFTQGGNEFGFVEDIVWEDIVASDSGQIWLTMKDRDGFVGDAVTLRNITGTNVGGITNSMGATLINVNWN